MAVPYKGLGKVSPPQLFHRNDVPGSAPGHEVPFKIHELS